MNLTKWHGAHEQIIAENQAGANTMQEWDGAHEQWTLEHEAGANTQLGYQLIPAWNAGQRRYVWAIKETCSI
jgi:hypothetical protein